MERFFGNRRITLYASGTAALAAAISECTSQKSVDTPEVIIPAYGCPDLVAACVHASVYPRLADIAPLHWSYDPKSLESKLSPNTVAIVAVNLLGVGDGSASLIPLCKDRNIALIQDSAQYLPRESIEWPGEYVVLSFGRGKPLNLLQGGALISRFEAPSSPAIPPAHYNTRGRLLSSRAAAMAFNALTRPAVYGAFSSLPGTGLGEVAYKPLANPGLLPERAWRQVAPAFDQFCQKPSYRRDIWDPAMKDWLTLGISALGCPGSPPPAEPLRLALLAPDRIARDRFVTILNRRGQGASRFYGTELPQVAGIPETITRQGPFPNASALAGRLFTLPTHALVTADTVHAARGLLLAAQHRQNRSA